MASKRKVFCVDEKVRLIRAIEKGERKIDVGRRLGLSPSTVATIWKNKEKFLQAEMEGKSRKKLKKPKFEDLDQAMLSWFNKQRQNNFISGPIVKAKAEKFAKQLGITEFKASEGWLGKFKHRHNIIFSKINQGSCEDLKTDENEDQDQATAKDTHDSKSKSMEKHLDQAYNITLSTINQGPYKDLQPDENKDKELATTASPTDEDILDPLSNSTEKQSEDDEDSQVNNSEPQPTIQQALDAVKLLEKFLLYNKDNFTRTKDKIKYEINTGIERKRQAKLTEYIYCYRRTSQT